MGFCCCYCDRFDRGKKADTGFNLICEFDKNLKKIDINPYLVRLYLVYNYQLSCRRENQYWTDRNVFSFQFQGSSGVATNVKDEYKDEWENNGAQSSGDKEKGRTTNWFILDYF